MPSATSNSYHPKFNEEMNETVRKLIHMQADNEAQARNKQKMLDAYMRTSDYNWLLPSERRAIRRLRIGLDYLRSAHHAFETGEIEPIYMIHKHPIAP